MYEITLKRSNVVVRSMSITRIMILKYNMLREYIYFRIFILCISI